jgi:acetoin utilization protein AcuB
MLVQDVMQHPVVSAEPSTTIAEAYRTMHDRSIRHLPVVDDGELVGVVTDRDLRYVTSQLHPSPMEAETAVQEVMTEGVVTAGPLDPVEEAARLLRKRRIGCLPVLDGDELVGIVTVTNLLDAIIRLTGLTKPGSRLAVSLVDEPGELARLTRRVAQEGLDVRSVLSYYEDEVDAEFEAAPDAHQDASPDADADADGDDTRLRVILRVNTLNTRPLAADLRDDGFDVVWPVEKPS